MQTIMMVQHEHEHPRSPTHAGQQHPLRPKLPTTTLSWLVLLILVTNVKAFVCLSSSASSSIHSCRATVTAGQTKIMMGRVFPFHNDKYATAAALAQSSFYSRSRASRLCLCNYRHPVESSTRRNITCIRRRGIQTSLMAAAETSSLQPTSDDDCFKNIDETTSAENIKGQKQRQSYHWTSSTLQITVPALIAMLADPLLSMVDTLYTGRVGPQELAALGACTSIFHLAFNAFRGFTSATTSLVAAELSKQKQQQQQPSNATPTTKTTSRITTAQRVTIISLAFSVCVGVVVAAVLYGTGPWALQGVGVPRSSPLFRPAHDYLYARLWAAPAVLWIGVAEGAFRGYANTVVPLVASLFASLLNLILDPILMFGRVGWGVKGAAAATAISQYGAAAVYANQLFKQNMLVPRGWRRKRQTETSNPMVAAKMTTTTTTSAATAAAPTISTATILRTILGANAAMLLKQGSLLLGWFYATRRAAGLGTDHLAAHQVGLSVWLIFAFLMDGASVAAQILMSRAYSLRDRPQVRSLIQYMLRVAVLQGVVSMLVLDGAELIVPQVFTTDPAIQQHLRNIIPHLAWQQLLVSGTLLVEGLAVGMNQFRILATGTALSTLLTFYQIARQSTVEGIWSIGIVSLFAGRLLTASLGCMNGYRGLKKAGNRKDDSHQQEAIP